MSTNPQYRIDNYSDDYLRCCLKLSMATAVDPFEFAEWVHARRIELSIGFAQSDEDDADVYMRMQYVRSLGRGV